MHCLLFFFFNDTATTEIYTLSLHDALPIFLDLFAEGSLAGDQAQAGQSLAFLDEALKQREQALQQAEQQRVAFEQQHLGLLPRSEEHTSELQSRQYLVCRLLLEKKKI